MKEDNADKEKRRKRKEEGLHCDFDDTKDSSVLDYYVDVGTVYLLPHENKIGMNSISVNDICPSFS